MQHPEQLLFTSQHVPALKGVPGFTHQRYSVNSVILHCEKAPGLKPAQFQTQAHSSSLYTVSFKTRRHQECRGEKDKDTYNMSFLI